MKENSFLAGFPSSLKSHSKQSPSVTHYDHESSEDNSDDDMSDDVDDYVDNANATDDSDDKDVDSTLDIMNLLEKLKIKSVKPRETGYTKRSYNDETKSAFMGMIYDQPAELKDVKKVADRILMAPSTAGKLLKNVQLNNGSIPRKKKVGRPESEPLDKAKTEYIITADSINYGLFDRHISVRQMQTLLKMRFPDFKIGRPRLAKNMKLLGIIKDDTIDKDDEVEIVTLSHHNIRKTWVSDNFKIEDKIYDESIYDELIYDESIFLTMAKINDKLQIERRPSSSANFYILGVSLGREDMKFTFCLQPGDSRLKTLTNKRITEYNQYKPDENPFENPPSEIVYTLETMTKDLSDILDESQNRSQKKSKNNISSNHFNEHLWISLQGCKERSRKKKVRVFTDYSNVPDFEEANSIVAKMNQLNGTTFALVDIPPECSIFNPINIVLGLLPKASTKFKPYLTNTDLVKQFNKYLTSEVAKLAVNQCELASLKYSE